MGETVRVEIRGEASSGSLRSLYSCLIQDPEWRGRVDVIKAPPQPETLSSGLPEALAIALAPGGVVAVLVGAVVSWARRQAVGDVVCKLSRLDGTSVEVSAPIARSLRGADEVRALVEDAVRQLERGSGAADGE
ncbi:effector-associated constant component EACC1 [Streptomyces sp. 900105755]